jgi:hypothetical protein
MAGGGGLGRRQLWGAARERFEADLAWLPARAQALRRPELVLLTERLDRLHHQVQVELARRTGAASPGEDLAHRRLTGRRAVQ